MYKQQEKDLFRYPRRVKDNNYDRVVFRYGSIERNICCPYKFRLSGNTGLFLKLNQLDDGSGTVFCRLHI